MAERIFTLHADDPNREIPIDTTTLVVNLNRESHREIPIGELPHLRKIEFILYADATIPPLFIELAIRCEWVLIHAVQWSPELSIIVDALLGGAVRRLDLRVQSSSVAPVITAASHIESFECIGFGAGTANLILAIANPGLRELSLHDSAVGRWDDEMEATLRHPKLATLKTLRLVYSDSYALVCAIAAQHPAITSVEISDWTSVRFADLAPLYSNRRITKLKLHAEVSESINYVRIFEDAPLWIDVELETNEWRIPIIAAAVAARTDRIMRSSVAEVVNQRVGRMEGELIALIAAYLAER